MGKESEDVLKWFHIKTGEKYTVLYSLCTHLLQCCMFEAGKCVASASWIPADLFTCRCLDALEHAKIEN